MNDKDVVVHNQLLGSATHTFVCVVGDSYIGPKRPVWELAVHLDYIVAFVAF